MFRRHHPFVFLAAFFTLVIQTEAQIAQAWAKRYNGPGEVDDAPAAIAVDANGDVAITGKSVGSDFTTNLYVAKYSGADGSFLWEKRYAGDSRGLFIRFDSAGDVCVAGAVGSANTAYLSKYAGATGNLLWETTYSSLNGLDAMTVDPSGNVIVCADMPVSGIYQSATAKFSGASGAFAWEKRDTQAQPRGLFPSTLLCDPGGNVFVGGLEADNSLPSYRYSFGVKHAAADGAVQWSYFYKSGSNALQTIVSDIDQVGAVYTSQVASAGGPLIVHKRGADGSAKWERSVTTAAAPADISVTPGGIVAVATAFETIQLNPDGTVHWQKADSTFEIQSVGCDSSGNVYLTGTKASVDGTNKDVLTRKLAPADGATLWEIRFNGPANKDDLPRGLTLLPGGAVAITGTESDGSYTDILTVKYVPPPAFEVSTLAATELGPDKATVSARVVPVGGATTVSFDYGTDPGNLTNSVAVTTTVPEGIQPVTVSASLSNLQRGTTYYFRARAANTGGSVSGQALNFTTPLTALVAVDDVIFVAGRQVTFSPQDNDLDSNHPASALTVTILTQPVDGQGVSVGAVSAVPGSTAVDFQAADTFVDAGEFTYRVQDPSGTTAEAKVTLRRFAAVAGTFQGIVSGPGGSGSLTVTINGSAGSFSGSLLFQGQRYALDGRLDTRGAFVSSLGATGAAFYLEISADGSVNARVLDAEQTILAAGELEKIDGGGGGFQPETGLYTTFLDIDPNIAAPMHAQGSGSPVPAGSGFVSVTVGKSAKRPARFAGILPDSVKFSAGVPGLAGRRYALAQQLYKVSKNDYRGAIVGQPAFPEDANNRLEAALDWTKGERPGDPLFPKGFGDLKLLLSAFRFVKTGRPIEFPQNLAPNLPNMRLEVSGGGLAGGFATFRVDPRNRAMLIADASSLQPKVKITGSPSFKGSFLPSLATQSVSFAGGFRQGGLGGESAGQGTFVTTASDGSKVTGKVRITVLE